MKKLFTFLILLALAIPAWAGEKTITISRNDVNWESANTVYNVTKGGVELVMSGGMNNPNFLLMKQHTTITVKSHNFNIKRIVFHCLDNYTNDNLDPFYWGPTTLHIQYSQTHQETAGTLTYNYGGSSYDALWVSTKSSSPGNYPNGLPAGYELMFENEGKPVRFASIDIVIEQEVGDIYELVTSQSEVQASTSSNKVTYMLVGRANANTTQGYALSVNTTGSTANDDIKSTPVTLLDNGLRVKANEETQFITLESTGNSSYPYYVKAGTNYIRTQSSLVEATGRRGYHLTKVANKPSEDYIRTKVTINSDAGTNNWGNFAAIKYQGSSFGDYAIRHIGQYTNDNGTTDYYQFRNLYDQAYSDRRVYLYKPAQQYKVTTEVQPEASYGTISLRDGVLVDNGTNWSQKMETVQFLVTPANGYKVKTITIQELNSSGNVVGTVDIATSAPSINGTLYTFEMPGNDVNIIVEFEEVTYHNINMVVKPNAVCGNIFITEGYVVQNDQVKSYDGQNVVFNVTPNPINPANESEGYYELINVTLTDNVTGVETVLVPDANGNYTFTMPDNEVTITANFRAKLMISTACEPNNGGYFEQSTMTCNGEGTNFYNGAQYYVDDYMTFMVKTNYGYSINKVVLTDGDGTETILSPTDIYNDGNFYGFTMPNSNVMITAYFYQSVSDLYLLGTHNGNTAWHSYGPKFEYDADTQTYSIEVYYKGVNTDYSQGTTNDGDKYGYFSFTKSVKGDINGDDWSIGPRYGSSSKNNDDVLGSYDNPSSNTATAGLTGGENCFKVPAGVYRIEVNKEITQTTITRLDVGLTFSPVGGNDEQSAPITSYGTKVTMASAIQNMVHNIADDYAADYPNYIANGFEEDDMSMTYSLAETTDLNTIKQSGAPTVADPTFTLLDYDIADGEPVVKVDGDVWLGWIHADNTAYYKVINTPLKWIEEEGTEGHKYTVADDLIIIHKIDRPGQRLLWAKDMSTYVTDPYNHPTNKYATFKTAYQTDYLDETLHVQAPGWGGWDQSNWVMLRFPENEDMSQYNINNFILAGTLVGTYVDDVNFCINVERMVTGGLESYVPNTFCTANFLDYNLNLNGQEGGAVSPSGKKFFFMNPKVQEVADVTLAVWDATNSRFVMPSGTGVNQAGITGFFTVNCLYNKDGDVISSLVDKNMYKFRGVLNVAPGGSNASKDAPTSPDATKMVMPFDLNDQSVATAISDVMGNKTVSSVKYYNITGIESDKPFNGVNIVVTRYTDGSFSTTKVLR